MMEYEVVLKNAVRVYKFSIGELGGSHTLVPGTYMLEKHVRKQQTWLVTQKGLLGKDGYGRSLNHWLELRDEGICTVREIPVHNEFMAELENL